MQTDRVVTIYRLTGNGLTYIGSTSDKLIKRVASHTTDVTCASYTHGISTAPDLSWNVLCFTNELNRYALEGWYIANYPCVNISIPKPRKGHPLYIPVKQKSISVKMGNELMKQAVRISRREEYLNKPRNIIKKGILYHINQFGECAENMNHDPYFFVTQTPFGKATQKNELYMKNRAYVEEKLIELKSLSCSHNYNCADCGASVCVPTQSVLRRHFASKKHLFSVGLITANEKKNHFYNKGVFDIGQPHENLVIAVQQQEAEV